MEFNRDIWNLRTCCRYYWGFCLFTNSQFSTRDVQYLCCLPLLAFVLLERRQAEANYRAYRVQVRVRNISEKLMLCPCFAAGQIPLVSLLGRHQRRVPGFSDAKNPGPTVLGTIKLAASQTEVHFLRQRREETFLFFSNGTKSPFFMPGSPLQGKDHCVSENHEKDI